MSPFGRPTFDPAGRVVARRELPLGERRYQPGEELAAVDREQLTDRQIATLWQLGTVDTLPREPAAAASRPSAKPAQPNPLLAKR